jgi:glycerol uptake facilitator protein
MLLLVIGDGVVAQVVAAGLGGHDSIAWAWGLAVTFGVYLAARLSGGHLNPAVTLALAAFRSFPWRKVAPYAVAQTAGAFVGALIVRWNFNEVLEKFDPGRTLKSQIVFATLPGNGVLPVGQWGALRDQVIGTTILLLLVFAVTDLLNDPPRANLGPLIVGLIVVAIGMAYGADAGYAINPARDLGPRIAAYLTGYRHAWRDQYGDLYFWVPIVGPLVGAVVGGLLYRLFVGRFLVLGGKQEEAIVPPPE